jgi:CBS domain-containing protein
MVATEISIPSRSAADLMTHDVRTIPDSMPLNEAAQRLTEFGVRGAPVVDDNGRCVGVFSVSDLARWTAGRSRMESMIPNTCSFQEKIREPGGRETVLCLMAEGVCPFQKSDCTKCGKDVLSCSQPHCVPSDWQMVECEPGAATVRDVMTTEIVSVTPDTSASDLARTMLEHRVHRLLVLDVEHHPVGIVTVGDVIRMLAYPLVSESEYPK